MIDKPIYVFYVGVADMDSSDIEKYLDAIKTRFLTEEFVTKLGGEVIVLPVRQIDSKFECINPKYITDDELLKKHRLLMDHLHDNLNDFIAQNKKEKE